MSRSSRCCSLHLRGWAADPVRSRRTAGRIWSNLWQRSSGSKSIAISSNSTLSFAVLSLLVGKNNSCLSALVRDRTLGDSCRATRGYSSTSAATTAAAATSTTTATTITNKSNNNNSNNNNLTEIRLSKWISQHAAISRREAERLIRAGDVRLAGQIVRSPAATVAHCDLFTGSAGLVVAGKSIHVPKASAKTAAWTTLKETSSSPTTTTAAATTTRVWLVHKLPGELVADVDPFNRPTVMQRLVQSGVGRGTKKRSREHLKAIGRLDMNTEGLLLVTNCGDYARAMELPSHQIHRVYRARVHGHVHPYKLQAMRRTVRIPKSLTTSTTQRDQDTKPKKHRQKPNSTKLLPQTPPHQHQQHGSDYYAPMKVELEQTRKRAEATNQWLKITCSEGKNRQIRNVLKHFGLTVTRLIRISYGDYQLQNIPRGAAVEVPVKSLSEHHRHRGPLFLPRRRPTAAAGVTRQTAEAATPPIQWVRHAAVGV